MEKAAGTLSGVNRPGLIEAGCPSFGFTLSLLLSGVNRPGLIEAQSASTAGKPFMRKLSGVNRPGLIEARG